MRIAGRGATRSLRGCGLTLAASCGIHRRLGTLFGDGYSRCLGALSPLPRLRWRRASPEAPACPSSAARVSVSPLLLSPRLSAVLAGSSALESQEDWRPGWPWAIG